MRRLHPLTDVHDHYHFNIHFLPRLIKGMDGCFPTAYKVDNQPLATRFPVLIWYKILFDFSQSTSPIHDIFSIVTQLCIWLDWFLSNHQINLNANLCKIIRIYCCVVDKTQKKTIEKIFHLLIKLLLIFLDWNKCQFTSDIRNWRLWRANWKTRWIRRPPSKIFVRRENKRWFSWRRPWRTRSDLGMPRYKSFDTNTPSRSNSSTNRSTRPRRFASCFDFFFTQFLCQAICTQKTLKGPK